MESAKYIFRLDDICPTMQMNQFWAYVELFRKHRVVPLLGVIPENLDNSLHFSSHNDKIWAELAKLQNENLVEIAQHGLHHDLSVGTKNGVLSKAFGRPLESEFAGLSLDQQKNRIDLGRKLLSEKGISTNYFMPPNHSYDYVTITALKDLGYSHISDGISLYPFQDRGMVFIPQQLWEPRKKRAGVYTICIHSSTDPVSKFYAIKSFLDEHSRDVLRFSDVSPPTFSIGKSVQNSFFKLKFTLRSRL